MFDGVLCKRGRCNVLTAALCAPRMEHVLRSFGSIVVFGTFCGILCHFDRIRVLGALYCCCLIEYLFFHVPNAVSIW